ncbi:hypothetical protein [Mammaliicoccus sciuri]|nr:hypothetical protein [Mammaliicoccus sciuri]
MKYNNIYIEKGDKHIVYHPSEPVKKTVTDLIVAKITIKLVQS